MKNYVFEAQSALVKNYEKLDRCIIIHEDGKVFMSTDGLVAYIIPESEWILGEMKFSPCSSSIACFTGMGHDYVSATITGTVKGKNVSLAVLESEHENVYINEKLLNKSFFPKGYTLSVYMPTAPVRVYLDKRLIGVIMPVRHEA